MSLLPRLPLGNGKKNLCCTETPRLTVLSAGCSGLAKLLSAAAMIAGLLAMDPSLKIMIVTKENVAAHAFARHFLRLELPDSINCLVGRLVGYVNAERTC